MPSFTFALGQGRVGLTPSPPLFGQPDRRNTVFLFDDLQFNGQKKKKSFQLPGKKENWMRERDLQGQPGLVWDPMNIPTKFMPWKKRLRQELFSSSV